MNSWQTELIVAARSSKASFESVELISNEAHGRAVIAILNALNTDSTAQVLAEARTPHRLPKENARPTDILILHPSLGCLLIEVKGWVIGDISRIEAGTFFRRVAGYEEAHNPWSQAQDASAQIQKAVHQVLQRRRLSKQDLPYFDWIVALPNISRSDWMREQYETCIAGCELLLKEDLENPHTLKFRIEQYIKAKAGYRLPFAVEQLNHVREALGNSDIIKSRNRRAAEAGPTTLGKLVNDLELKDKRLSKEQFELINSEFDGRPQLIRGVAGSGKSIVLVQNLVNLIDRQVNRAQLLLGGNTEPKRYAVVCYNRSLVPFLRRHFEDAYRALTYRDPPACVDIYHMNGLQYSLTSKEGGPLRYLRWKDVDANKDTAADFASNYSEQLDILSRSDKSTYDRALYDAIYVDEGQDLFEIEYLFLMRLLRVDATTGEKNIVVFYDDAQNVYGRPRPVWSKLGIQIRGGRTHVMRTCFRNSKPIIDFAFNLLLGVRAETRAATRTFADVAYLQENDLVRELPDRWQVNFADRTEGLTPTVHLFSTRDAETTWLAETIAQLIQVQNVLAEDILVIFTHYEFEGLITKLRRICPLIEGFLKPFGKHPDKDAYIFKPSHITLATLKAAKGYDAPVVFLVGADLFQTDVTGRASFYVAASRCKSRLYVTGMQVPSSLAEEAKAVADLLLTPVLPSPSATFQQRSVVVQPPPAIHKALAKERVPASTFAPSQQGPTVVQPPPIIHKTPVKENVPFTNLVRTRLRQGDRVRHPAYGEGVVLSDAKEKRLSSQKILCQEVDVQFGTNRKNGITAELAGLTLL